MENAEQIEVSDVFKTKGTPTYTYVSVSAGTYENQLRDAIKDKGTLCLITGPSKTGKTTLIANVCGQLGLRPLIVRCNAALTQQQLWKKALEQVDFRRPTTSKKRSNTKFEIGSEVGGALGWSWLAELTGKFSAKTGQDRNEEASRERILADPGPEHLIPVLRHLPILLIIEDFHYLSPDVQKNVFQEWKAFVDEEVSVAVIETSHHACDIAFANKDLIGRVFHLPLTTWTEKDLAEIPLKGFSALNVKMDPSIARKIAREAVGLPLLSQAICLEISLAHGIRQKQFDNFDLQLNQRELFKILHNIALNKFGHLELMYERITRGLRTGKRNKYKTYEYMLSVFSLDPIVYKLTLPKLTNRFDDLPVDKSTIPPTQIVKGALSRLEQLQAKIGAQLLEWHDRDETLYILEPSFLFYLRWRKQRLKSSKFMEYVRELLSNINTKGSSIRSINISVGDSADNS